LFHRGKLIIIILYCSPADAAAEVAPPLAHGARIEAKPGGDCARLLGFTAAAPEAPTFTPDPPLSTAAAPEAPPFTPDLPLFTPDPPLFTAAALDAPPFTPDPPLFTAPPKALSVLEWPLGTLALAAAVAQTAATS